MSDKKSSLAISHIMASSVHDMKNSLSMLIDSLDDLTDSLAPTNDAAAAKLAQLKYETKRVNNQLVQLLTLFKLDNAQYYLNIGEIEVADFLDELALANSELLTQKGISIEIAAAPDLIGYFDANLVAGVINNVINNAYKYARDKIRLSASEEDKWLVLCVMDNGPGYPPEMLEDGQGGKTGVSFESGSTGLGLYFSSAVAALHTNKERRGYIVLDNQGIDGGGRFRLFLP